MSRDDPLTERRVLRRYLLDGEQIIHTDHQHWAKVAEPVATAIGGLVLVLVLDTALDQAAASLTNLLWWAWFFSVARAVWMLAEWRHDWFVATDKRLLLTHGLLTSKVAMMPLAKVTDMSYNRSPIGRLLGYGVFVMESAGQDQALHNVRWVRDPDHTYRKICAEIFQVDDHDRVSGSGVAGAGGMPGGAGPALPPGPRGGGHGGSGQGGSGQGVSGQAGDDQADYSTAIRVRPVRPDERSDGYEDGSSDTLYQSPDLRERSLRDADTGPIPLWRPSADS